MTNVYTLNQNRVKGRTNGMEKSLYIYFDYREVNGITCGVAIYEREGSAVELYKKFNSFEKLQGENNFHYTFRALILALESYLDIAARYPNHNIVLMNQNERVFCWLEEGVTNPIYSELLEEVDSLLESINLQKLRSKIIPGKTNRVKRLLSAIKEKQAERPMNMSRIKERQLSPRRLKIN